MGNCCQRRAPNQPQCCQPLPQQQQQPQPQSNNQYILVPAPQQAQNHPQQPFLFHLQQH